MAGNSQTVSPADQEFFARSLYNSIWLKFGLVASDYAEPTVAIDPDAPTTSIDVFNCTEDIFRAVICEQLLIRDFLKNSFFCTKNSLIVDNTDSVVTFCNVMCQAMSEKWDFYKKILRCSALIAEFFLYRCSLKLDLQLQLDKVPKIWSTVFNEHFAENFHMNGGWDGLNTYSEIYDDDLYAPLDKAISQMMAPYEEVPTNCLQNLPELEKPMTYALKVFAEMFTALNCVDVNRMPPESPKSSLSSRNGKKKIGSLYSPIFSNQPSCSRSPQLSVSPQPDVKDIVTGFLDKLNMDPNPLSPISDLEKPADPVGDLEKPADPVVDLEKPANMDVDLEKPADMDVDLEKPADMDVDLEKPADMDVDLEKPADMDVDLEKPAVMDVNLGKPVDPVVDLEKPEDPDVDLEKPADPVVDLEKPADPAVDLERPADPDEESMNVDETSPPKGLEKESVEDVLFQPHESPDLHSRKRTSRVLDTTEDIKPPSPKQPKPDTSAG